MQTNINHQLYRSTRKKYLKFLSRYKKAISSKTNGSTTFRYQRKLANTLNRLYRQLKSLELKLKLGFAVGSIAFALHFNTANAQQLGPFVQNDQNNPFKSGISLDNNKQPFAVDLDNDGDFDIVVGIQSGYLEFLENVGTANNPEFIRRTGIDNPFDGIYNGKYSSPSFGDFDGDGDQDMIFGSYYNRPRHFENYGDASSPSFNTTYNSPSFLDNVYTSFPVTANYYSRPELVDIDNDGDLDIFLGRDFFTNDYSAVAFWQNDGSNNFTEQIAGSNPLFLPLYNANANVATRFDSTYPSFVDIDNDGDLDLFVGDQNGYIRFFQNTGNATVPSFSNEITGAGNPLDGVDVGNDASPEFVDLDNDGDFDLIVGSSLYGALNFFENVGTASSPSFVEVAGNASPFGGFNSSYDVAPTAVDIDGDGFLDVVLGVKYDSELRYFRNNQNGNFIEQTGGSNPFTPLAGNVGNVPVPAFADIDNDGDADLFVTTDTTNYGPTRSEVLFFRNNGTFDSEVSPITTYQNYTEFASSLADFDGDLDFDVLIGGYGVNYSTSNFQFVRNDGNVTTPSFTEVDVNDPPVNNINIGYGFLKPYFTDLDHDGDPDVVAGISAGTYSGQLFFFENDGTSLNQVTGAGSPFFNDGVGANFDFGSDSQPALLDIDNDGDLDVLVGLSSNEILYLENQNIPAQISTTGTTTVTYNEGDLPVLLANGLSISDATNDPIRKARVVIENYISGEDLLDFDPGFGTSGTFETTGPNAGILTIDVPPTTLNSELAMVLSGVTYENIGATVTGTPRTIRFEVIDFDNTNPGSADVVTITVNVIPTPNDPPVLASSSGDLTYTEGDGIVTIDGGITVTDSDNASLVGATVTITNNFAPSNDFVEFANQNGITGSFDNSNGILTLSGTSSVANYQTALRSVVYNNISNNPSSLTRTVSFTVNDGTDDSNTITRDIVVVPVNDPPSVVSENGQNPLSYTQNTVAVAIDPLIEVFDVDNTTIAGATVTITDFQSGDEVAFNNQNGITGSVNAGTLTLSGSATLAQYQTALRTVTFRTSNGAGSRLVNFTANDGEATSIPYPRTINISGSSTQPPVVNTTPTTTQVGSVVTIDLCQIISDPDNDFDELFIEVISTLSGAATTKEDCNLRIDYSGLNFSGEDNIVVRATDPDGNTDENTLIITVESSEPGGDLIIYNAVSPNGDGLNDWWEIVNLTSPNKIQLFNRWGDLVKTLSDYESIENNTQLNDIPAGTYFYKIESPQGSYEGFIVIKK
ncbi:MAG: FG-GAP-like repeat-containing protein [Fulvivirga sp.]|uniref:FG-GAP-like repeat-containing protein n=1 Tax=Fulvivirga sp. TaxID=1931237 RepID=UPI0032EAF863